MLSEDKFAVEIEIWNITDEESDQDKEGHGTRYLARGGSCK